MRSIIYEAVFHMFRLGLAEKYDFLLNYMKNMAGGEGIGFNNSVFLSGPDNPVLGILGRVGYY